MVRTRRFTLRLAAAATAWAAVLGLSAPAGAQTAGAYPSKPIRLIVPYPAGGGADTIARALGAPLSQAWGVPVVIENKPGASGNTGNDLVAKAPPDGYTVLIGITAMIQTPALYAKLPYDVLKDFAPVSQIARSADLFVVHRDIPARTLQEFVALAKSQPGKLSYGNYGNGTSSHMHGELFKLGAGVDLAAVPYKGAAPLVNDMLGGQLSSAFIDATSANPHLKSDKFRILAITGLQRHPALPEVPTFAEAGLNGFESNGWFGAFVPAGTPKPLVDKLSAEIRKIVASSEVSGRLSSMGLRPVGSTPEELAAVMVRDMPRWARIVKDARITLE
ncbi:MAG: tripartite tricarboxylate transporter substrate binding protein [Burkholderiaceae bacterium]|nr:tripartite tricarboxylate transporter substrate binding protein [Burkholderiaceae bacterium]